MRMNRVKEKETKLNEYNKMIDETEKTYMRVYYDQIKLFQIVDTSNKLAANLDKESNFIREKIRKNPY